MKKAMPQFESDPNFYHGKQESVGVLIINLGTPDKPTTSSVRKYLREFLSDQRVVEIPRALWFCILNFFILTTRPKKSAKAYKKVWTDEGSPLLVHSQNIVDVLQKLMDQSHPAPIHIELAMRYGNPSIQSGLEKLRDRGARKILILPLYPQYSATTTATSFEKVFDIVKKWRWMPELRFISSYHDSPAYIQALAKSIQAHWNKNGKKEHLLMSFHGIPKRNLELGDPYHCYCLVTGRLLADALKLTNKDWTLTFQSRFGKAEWLQPYTDETLKSLPGKGIKSLDVICPGFPADCLETLEEMNMENREVFIESGGEEYDYIPALNDSQPHILALTTLIHQHIAGWPQASKSWNSIEAEQKLEFSAKRAKVKGAKL